MPEPEPSTRNPERIVLAHGSGGTMMRKLIEQEFASVLHDVQLEDAASLELPAALSPATDPPATNPSAAHQQPRLAFSTDTFVVRPLFFPGGDIGHLAVCGTVNDVACSGATPLWLSLSFVLEEGFALSDLRRILTSIVATARQARVSIVTGDTKVVERGAADGIFINTAGIGILPPECTLSAAHARPGDRILLSGTLGDHGICIVSQREGLSFSTDIKSDAAPLAQLVAATLAAAPHTRLFRDPTRGGLASALNEIADASHTSLLVNDADVPVKSQVRGACDMLGYDVYQVANEGKMVAIVPPDEANAALAAMRKTPYGAQAAIIGEVSDTEAAGRVSLHTSFGATRIMDTLVGEQLPRIC
jgi:hydrogenase expression/formation protein HypE